MGQKNLIPIRELNPAITSQVANALEKALAVKPDDRFPSAVEFAAALATDTSPVSTILHQATPTVVMRPTMGTQPMPAPTAGTVGVPPVKPQGNRWLLPVIVIGVVLLLTVGGGAGLLAAKVFGGSQATATPTSRPTATLSVIIDLSTETPTPAAPEVTAT
jgi:hypothetical protein